MRCCGRLTYPNLLVGLGPVSPPLPGVDGARGLAGPVTTSATKGVEAQVVQGPTRVLMLSRRGAHSMP